MRSGVIKPALIAGLCLLLFSAGAGLADSAGINPGGYADPHVDRAW